MHSTFEGKAKGDRLYYCGKEWTITAIGRKWVTAIMVEAPIDRRFNIKTAVADVSGLSYREQCYATREEMEAAQCQS